MVYSSPVSRLPGLFCAYFFMSFAQAGPPRSCIAELQEVGLVETGSDIRDHPRILDILRSVDYLKYPESFYEILANTDFLEKSPASLNRGAGLKFVLPMSELLGVNEQARLAAVVLGFYLPMAEIIFEQGSAPKSLDGVRIDIDDPTFFVDNVLDMLLAKPANAQAGNLPRVALRKFFGIGPKIRVVSLYTKNNKDPQIWPALRGFDIAILSTNPYEGYQFSLPSYLLSSVLFVPLSQLRLGQPPQLLQFSRVKAKQILIINDVRGYLPHLHALSNLVVVRGNLNFFEALNAGTPTLLSVDLRNEDVNIMLLRRAVETAELTDAFKFIWHERSLEMNVQELSSKTPLTAFRRPYLLGTSDTNSVRIFVQALEEYLQNQTRHEVFVRPE